MQLNMKQFALATGVLWGLALFVVTLAAAARGIGNNLSHISAIFIGYQVTYLGSVIGLIYGFVSGLIAGSLFAMVYNRSKGGAANQG
jgi:hypothetical protein